MPIINVPLLIGMRLEDIVVAYLVSNLKHSDISNVLIQKGSLSADYCVDLAKSIHRSQVRKFDVGWDQVDIPEYEQSVEVDDTLHCEV